MKLNQVRAVITGGASGLGNAVAQRLVAAGAKVTLLDVNEAAGQAAAKALGAAARFPDSRCDQRERRRPRRWRKAQSDMGGLNLAVNCAGIGWPRRIVNKEGPMPGDLFRKVIEVNLVGTLLVAKSAAGAMQQQHAERRRRARRHRHDGVGRRLRRPDRSGRLLRFQRRHRRHDAADGARPVGCGIRVMTIAPGIFKTPMMAALPQEAQDSLGKQVPFPPRLGRPDEYAALVAHICENTMLNGECIRLDGAIRMAPK